MFSNVLFSRVIISRNVWYKELTLYQSRPVATLSYKTIKDIMKNGENTGNQHFLFFPLMSYYFAYQLNIRHLIAFKLNKYDIFFISKWINSLPDAKKMLLKNIVGKGEKHFLLFP